MKFKISKNIAFSLTQRRWRLAAGVFAGLIFVATHIPQRAVPEDMRVGGYDKIPHFVLYGLLTWLILKAMGTVLRNRWGFVLVLFMTVLIGGVDELTQPAFGRSCCLSDWLADVFGVVLAILFVMCFIFLKHRRALAANE